MKKMVLALFAISTILATPLSAKTDSAANPSMSMDQLKKKMDSMDKIAGPLGDSIKSMDEKLKAAQEKIDAKKAEMEAEKKGINFTWPIIGGAVLGIALALWLRSRKSK